MNDDFDIGCCIVDGPPNQKRKVVRHYRPREYLFEHEVAAMVKAARGVGRNGARDAAMILAGYRHGLRACELVGLTWPQIDFEHAQMHIRRAKHGKPARHPVRGDEIRLLRALQRGTGAVSGAVFQSERGGAISTDTVRVVVRRAGELAGLPFIAHPHMLRHGCGYYLANKGNDTRAIQDYLGHRSIQHTVRYTELATNRFDDFWQE